jgi:hypothetical protein
MPGMQHGRYLRETLVAAAEVAATAASKAMAAAAKMTARWVNLMMLSFGPGGGWGIHLTAQAKSASVPTLDCSICQQVNGQ